MPIVSGDVLSKTPERVAKDVVASKDVLVRGENGSQHRIKEGQVVPLEYIDAYKEEVGDAQFKKEVEDRLVSPILRVHAGVATTPQEKEDED
jgi:hypothetical protein